MFQGVKVFSVTKFYDRESLGETITAWLRENQDKEIVDKVVRQSSDSEYHCLTCVIFWRYATTKETV